MLYLAFITVPFSVRFFGRLSALALARSRRSAKPHTVPSGTGDQLPVTSSGLGLGTQSPAIGWGLTGDWGLSLQPEGWDWGLSHQLMLGTAAGLGTGVPA